MASGARAVLPPGRLAVLSLPLLYAAPAAWTSASRAAGPLGLGQGPAGRASQPARRELGQGLPGGAAGPLYPAGSDSPHKDAPSVNDLSEPEAVVEAVRGGAAAMPGDGVKGRAAPASRAADARAEGQAHSALLELAGAVLVAGTAIVPL